MSTLDELRAKRLLLIENLAAEADQIAAIDCEIEEIQMMQFLEDDLNQQQEATACE